MGMNEENGDAEDVKEEENPESLRLKEEIARLEKLEEEQGERFVSLAKYWIPLMIGLMVLVAFLTGYWQCGFFLFPLSYFAFVAWFLWGNRRLKELKEELFWLNYGELVFEDSLKGWKKFLLTGKRLVLISSSGPFGPLLAAPVVLLLGVLVNQGLEEGLGTVIILLGFMVFTYFFIIKLILDHEECVPVKLTTRGIHVSRGSWRFFTFEELDMVFLEAKKERFTTFLLTKQHQKLHVEDVSGFLKAMEGLLDERWKQIYLDKTDTTNYGSVVLKDSLKGLRKLRCSDRDRFLTTVLGGPGAMVLVILSLLVIIPFVLLLASLDGYYLPWVILFFWTLLFFGLFKGYRMILDDSELRETIFTTRGIDLVNWGDPRDIKSFVRFSDIQHLHLKRKEERCYQLSFRKKDGDYWGGIAVGDGERIQQILKDHYQERWAEVFREEMTEKSKYQRYSDLKDRKGILFCPVCDIVLEDEPKECPQCDLDLSRITVK